MLRIQRIEGKYVKKNKKSLHTCLTYEFALFFQGSAQVTKAMGSMMEDLSNATYGAYKTYTSSQTSESVLLFVCSLAR